jgi:hypothetical protein
MVPSKSASHFKSIRVSARGGWGISPPSNDSRGDILLNLSFMEKHFLVMKI